MGPRGVGVRMVARPHQPVDFEHVDALERDAVVLERHVDVLAEVLGRLAATVTPLEHPLAVTLKSVSMRNM